MTKSPVLIYPVLPLRDIVVLPGMISPLFVSRDRSIKALDTAMKENSLVFLLTQISHEEESPTKIDFYTKGCVGKILQLLTLPDGAIKILVEGLQRGVVKELNEEGLFITARVKLYPEDTKKTEQTEALMRTLLGYFETYITMNKKISADILELLKKIEHPGKLADTACNYLTLKIPEKQKILEETSVNKRLEMICILLGEETGNLKAEKDVQRNVKSQIEKRNREFYLNEQMNAILKELGEHDDTKKEMRELEEKIKKIKFTKEAREKIESELKKLKNMSPMSSEANILRNYVEWLMAVPWNKNSKTKHDITEAEAILERDHYGLEKVKERIVEHMAVQKRVQKIKGPILCFVGPPGVGKTSLARSIAEATGRNFIRMSLGGVRDEAEIRGHRRTYIGALPGKIIQSMKKAKTSNPLFLLDEIDKLGTDFRGDPASALLEVLDPEQNKNFNDHYLEVDYDLSKVMFVATANSLNMPRPLLDRMEIIRLSGYTEDEKVEIAKRHLITKQTQEHGLKEKEWSIDDSALYSLVRYYTREAGVRNLEREIAKLARKIVYKILEKKDKSIHITEKNVKSFLGIRKFTFGEAEKENHIGVVTGLAYTEMGGDLLSIEVVTQEGKGTIKFTGKLGQVMQESIQAAYSFARSHALLYGILPSYFQKHDVHVHVPEGGVPKDGPSAGAAIFTAIISAMTNIAVRSTIAMTGEVTLRGRVLAIGGLKEKLLAALRGNIKTVLIPYENEKDLEEIPENVKKNLSIIPVKNVEEVLRYSLVKMPEAIDAPLLVPFHAELPKKGKKSSLPTSH